MPDGSPPPFGGDDNLMASDSPGAWERLIEAVGPASLLVVIEARMSPRLRKCLTPDDILQDVLLHAWRDRAKCEWRGLRSFRSWLLTIIDHRLRDAAEAEAAAKRGGGQAPVLFSALAAGSSGTDRTAPYAGPPASTTPSRIAMHREQAAIMRVALESLPDELREVVRLRLFEQVSIEEAARQLGIGSSAVRHRFRKGAGLYHRRLVAELGTRTQTIPAELRNAVKSVPASE